MRVVLASHNPGKIREITALLADLPIELSLAAELAIPEVAETGQTFHENALIKAQSVAEASGMPAIADDSGLCVHALDGVPGVNSHRWVEGSDQDRRQKVLELLTDHQDRSAHFISIVCWYDPSRQVSHFFTGRLDGSIAMQSRGTNGFGYDPLFIPEGRHETLAELELADKNQLSARASALQKLREFATKIT